MAAFTDILNASAEKLVNLFYASSRDDEPDRRLRVKRAAARLGLRSAHVICGLGFNKIVREVPDVTGSLGYRSYEQLADDRNIYFINDIYQHLTIDDILAIYLVLKEQYSLIPVVQYLLTNRVNIIEQRIDNTVNPVVIERYKKELRTLYAEGIAQIDFAEERLKNTHSGFRALVNEIGMMVDTKLIPIGEIFFRNTVLPEEKRKLIIRNLVPAEFLRARLTDPVTPEKERNMLAEYLPLMSPE